MNQCPCGSGRASEDCCGPILAGTPAPTAESLMRARYTAFVTQRVDEFAYETLAPEKRADFDREAVEQSSRDVEGLGMEVRHVVDGGAGDETGSVEYVARFRVRGKKQIHHELATFRREDGRWLYVDGNVNPKSPPRRVVKVGRNEPCPCGSGKKYKTCCAA